jgi:hypothetical protein
VIPQVTGGCACGAVRHVLTPRIRINACTYHCNDCQKRVGGALVVRLPAHAEDARR